MIDTLERRQLAVIRLMSLNQTKYDPRTTNKTSKVEGEARTTLEGIDAKRLIAQLPISQTLRARDAIPSFLSSYRLCKLRHYLYPIALLRDQP